MSAESVFARVSSHLLKPEPRPEIAEVKEICVAAGARRRAQSVEVEVFSARTHTKKTTHLFFSEKSSFNHSLLRVITDCLAK